MTQFEFDDWAHTIEGMIKVAYNYNELETLEDYADNLHKLVEKYSSKDDKSYELHMVENLADYCEDCYQKLFYSIVGECEVQY